MCGRYSLHASLEDLQELLPGVALPEELPARWNVAPTQEVPVVPDEATEEGSRRLAFYRWGLVPSWADDPRIGNRLINARAETLSRKPAFRDAYRSRRCLVLADGFYEWRAEPDARRKTPFHFRRADGRPFAFAGLWERWRGPRESWLRSCCIVTTRPNELVAEVHDRMPAILPRDAMEGWLDDRASSEELARLLEPIPSDELVSYPVSRVVSSPRNDVPECVEPVSDQPDRPRTEPRQRTIDPDTS